MRLRRRSRRRRRMSRRNLRMSNFRVLNKLFLSKFYNKIDQLKKIETLWELTNLDFR